MHKKKVDVLQPELLQSLPAIRLNVPRVVLVIPELAADEQFLPGGKAMNGVRKKGDPTVIESSSNSPVETRLLQGLFYCFTHLGLVSVERGAVEVPIAALKETVTK